MAQYEHILHAHRAPYNAKAFQGAALYQRYDAIKSILEGFEKPHLIPYFAIPNIDPLNNDMTWTALSDGGHPIAMAELSQQEQQDLVAKIQAIHDELAQLVQRIESKRGANDASNLLLKLLDPPDKRHIYSVGGMPVFVYWSHEQEDPVPGVKHPLIARIDTPPLSGSTNEQTSHEDGRAANVSHSSAALKTIYIYANWVHFVGAVSFFGIALAAILLAIAITFYSGLNKRLDAHSFGNRAVVQSLALSCASSFSYNKAISLTTQYQYSCSGSNLQEI